VGKKLHSPYDMSTEVLISGLVQKSASTPTYLKEENGFTKILFA